MWAPGRKAGSSVSAENHRQNSPISVRARHTRERGARMKVLRWIWFNGDTSISNLLVAYYDGARRNATVWLHVGQADVAQASACSAETLLGATGREESRPSRQECLRHDTGIRSTCAAILARSLVCPPLFGQNQVPVNLQNSQRAHDLIRAGNLYLSLQYALSPPSENTLDIELQRFAFPTGDAELLRSQGGGTLRGLNFTLAEVP